MEIMKLGTQWLELWVIYSEFEHEMSSPTKVPGGGGKIVKRNFKVVNSRQGWLKIVDLN